MTYARARLWLGISGVGFWVVLAAVGLWWELPKRLLPGLGGGLGMLAVLAVYIALSLPFDLFGGYLLPRWHGRSTATLESFLEAWLRGVLAQGMAMGVAGLAIVEAANVAGTLGAMVCVVGGMVVLLLAQGPIARLVGGLTVAGVDLGAARTALERWKISLPRVAVYEGSDAGFVGGMVGWPGSEQLIVPGAWVRQLAPERLAVELARRVGVLETGARWRGVALGLGWNSVGFALAARGQDLSEVAGLVTAALWFTLWSFGGLLLLPTLSRPAVFAADQFARRRGVGEALLAETMQELDRRQDDERVRGRWIERIFHPAPSVGSRMVGRKAGSPGAWQGARIALYLSWAGLGLLSRAVHCNSGRPELWVLFPGD